MQVTLDGDDFVVACNGEEVPALAACPGWRRHSASYRAPTWPSSILFFPRTLTLQWTPRAMGVRDALLAALNQAKSRSLHLENLGRYSTARKPRRHQVEALQAMAAMRWRCLLADEMGLGKTSTLLWAWQDSSAEHLLVVCPVSAKFNWEREVQATLGDWCGCTVVDGPPKRRADALATGMAISGPSAIVINYDLLRHLNDAQLAALKAWVAGSFVALDESHYLKDRRAQRTGLVMDLASTARCVVAMTGTPIRNLAEDLFTQVSIVRPRTWTSYHDFAQRYLVVQRVRFGAREVVKTVGAKNLTELNGVVNTLQIKRTKAEVGGLPPKIHSYPELELEGDLLAFYKAMKEFAKIELSKLCEGPVMSIFDPRAKSAIEQAMRCEQIAQGFCGGIPEPVMAKVGENLKSAVKIEGRPNELIFPHAPKLVWLLETIESVLAQGGAPIVYSRFNAPLFWLDQELRERGHQPAMLYGGLTAEAKHSAVVSFQDSTTKVLLCQVKIAEAWNATRCQDVLFLGRDWSPAINAQAEDRAHRMGQSGTVNVQIPVVQNTIEKFIHKVLTAKAADAEQALRNVTVEDLLEAL